MNHSQWSSPRQRVRCRSVQAETTPDSQCRVRVEVEWAAGTCVEGVGSGNATRQGMLIAGALATLDAIGRVTQEKMKFEFRGAKSVRAFDSLVVVVAVRGRAAGRRYDLLGCCAASDNEVARGGVLAVLDATNRILERYAHTPGGPLKPAPPTDRD